MSVVSTGTVYIRPQHLRFDGTPPLWWLLTSRRWIGPLPINAFLIEHADGLVLFDTGQDQTSVTDPDYFPKGFTGLLNRRLARFDVAPDQTLTARLAGIGYDIADVHTVVLSHLHIDHVGGLPELRHATIVVSGEERRTLERPFAEVNGLMRNHIMLPGLRWQLITPQPTDDPSLTPFTDVHDLFGDGSLVLLPTPGHTPGSLSLLVRRPDCPPLLMVGDLTFDVHLMESGQVPGLGQRSRSRESTRKVNIIRQSHPDLVILPTHDPEASARLAVAEQTKPASGR
ncbi:N-acyl homoserine lactonase family protein [Kribbella sp. NBC_00359]|uniref:N-acyl homoserine lactonase family protein n=1 Tax=Kribbella sp. NBC_00359 TaxID=2975966 RepID=UPI002E1C14CC